MQRKNELVSSPIPDYLRSGFPGVHFRGRVLYTHFRRLQVRFYSAQLRGASSSSLPARPLRREPACCGAMWLSERAEQDTRLCEKPASAAAPLRQSGGGSGVSVWQSRAEQSLPPGALCCSSCRHAYCLTSLCRLVTPILSAE